MYRVEFQRAAKKDLDALPKTAGDRIALTVAGLASNPRRGARKVAGSANLYRVRIGPYRAIYAIREQEKKAVILRVARRTERTYRGL